MSHWEKYMEKALNEKRLKAIMSKDGMFTIERSVTFDIKANDQLDAEMKADKALDKLRNTKDVKIFV